MGNLYLERVTFRVDFLTNEIESLCLLTSKYTLGYSPCSRLSSSNILSMAWVTALVPRQLPDFISQPWRKIGFFSTAAR